jgi:2-octaprenylphenol hydroxylase
MCRQNRLLPVVDQQTDITIVGAGMVGAAAALSLSRGGFNITLIEANATPQWSAEEYGLRVSAISAASERLLEDVGVWQPILNRRASPYEAMHVWDAGGSGGLDFDAADSGQASLGHIVENNLINASLVEEIQNKSNINCLTGSRLSDLSWLHDAILIKLENGKEIRSTLVIAADGGNSQVRSLCGIEVSGHDYWQTGIVTRVRTSLAHENAAWQRFLPTGPLAFLPLADGSCSIVWSADQELAAELLELDDEEFSQQLAEAFEHRLGDVRMLSPRAGFPLQLANADSYSTERVVLLGDAAHRVHPLAGQGVNLGFQDVIDLTATLLEARQNGRGLADPLYLRKYARKRRADASLMLAGMDGIQRAFGSDLQLVCKSRNLVMDLISQLPGLKQFFVNRALGKETAINS